MTKQVIIERTVKAINRLPAEKAEEISNFADFIIKQYEDHLLSTGIAQLATESKTFEFLHDEEDLYTEADIKDSYNA